MLGIGTILLILFATGGPRLPGTLISIAAATLAVYLLASAAGVAVIGQLPSNTAVRQFAVARSGFDRETFDRRAGNRCHWAGADYRCIALAGGPYRQTPR